MGNVGAGRPKGGGIDWDSVPELGVDSDTAIARRYNVSRSNVSAARRVRKMPSSGVTRAKLLAMIRSQRVEIERLRVRLLEMVRRSMACKVCGAGRGQPCTEGGDIVDEHKGRGR